MQETHTITEKVHCLECLAHLWPGIHAADAANMDIARHEANANFSRFGDLVQALHKGRALAQVRLCIPVVYDDIQQLFMHKPAGAALTVEIASKMLPQQKSREMVKCSPRCGMAIQ